MPGLTLKRMEGQSLLIGDDVEVELVAVEGLGAYLKTRAPGSVVIQRKEDVAQPRLFSMRHAKHTTTPVSAPYHAVRTPQPRPRYFSHCVVGPNGATVFATDNADLAAVVARWLCRRTAKAKHKR